MVNQKPGTAAMLLFVLCLVVGPAAAQDDPWDDDYVGDGDDELVDFCQPPDDLVAEKLVASRNSIKSYDVVLKAQNSQVDWNQVLLPAPMAIKLLGQLLLVTARKDVSIVDGVSKDEAVNYIKYPRSLRATFNDLGNEAYNALANAHNNMGRIQVKTKRVPTYFRQVVQLITKSPATTKAKWLPLTLKRLRGVAEECAELASQTADKFGTVSAFINQLINVVTSTRSIRSDDLDASLVQMKVTENSLTQHQDTLDNYDGLADQWNSALTESLDKLQATVNDRPNGGELFAAACGDAFVGILNSVGSMLGGDEGSSNNGANQQTTPQPATTKPNAQAVADGMDLMNFVESQLDAVKLHAKSIVKYLTNQKLTEAKTLKDQLCPVVRVTEMRPDVAALPADLTTPFAQLMADATSLCDEFDELVKLTLAQTDDETLAGVRERAETWTGDYQTFYQTVRLALNIPPKTPVSPAQYAQAQGSQQQSIAAGVMNGWREQLAGQQAHVEFTQAQAQLFAELLDKAIEKQALLSAKLDKLELDVDNLEQTIQVLAEAFTYLGQLRSRWLAMAAWFKRIATVVVNDEWKAKLDEFAVNVEQHDGSSFADEAVYRSAFDATSSNYRLYKISTTYYKISNVHFMPPLRNLSMLLTIDATAPNGEHQLTVAKKNLDDQLTASTTAIAALIKKDLAESAENMAAYQEELRKQFAALCPKEEESEDDWEFDLLVKQGVQKAVLSKPTPVIFGI